MAVDINADEGRMIRQLIPLSHLSINQFAQLCETVEIETLEAGNYLFRRGDTDANLYYLLSGVIALRMDSLTIDVIKAATGSAKFAIAHQCPRKIDAIAETKIRFLRLNADMLKARQSASEQTDNPMTEDDEDIETGDDWMATLLKSPVFRGLSPANLQKILISLQQVQANPGDVIISQGDPGDYYYIIKKGRVLFSRKPTPNAKDIRLGEMGDLDSFGEDALISGKPRNVTVTALTPVSLLRLNKDQFINLIKNPSLKFIEYKDIDDHLKQGALLIDVRGPDEFGKRHLPHSVNMPFFSLRMHIKSLNRQQPIIVACDDSKTSEAAAFILLRQKFTALILKGGLQGAARDHVIEPATFTIDDGVETSNLQSPVSDISAEPSTEIQNRQKALPDGLDPFVVIQHLNKKCKLLEADKANLEIRCAHLTQLLEAARKELAQLKPGI
ncbi:MAG: cyclic nucleotide-binding domain-containing protein [Methylomonas sp.]|nr:cyclic nucleotide-binding domain-containing protein [Methylomonas sp.]PPD22914.1 MAG: Crp/Fnr family transcriptional regulator [Methylomonas sp.]PPD27364.1 MAG: Crp/Fnr family transcriptional regulator [Methylomonas sp.]PPD39340.1 MAG: Crp/Fnr family transcriptional regulator [Methylomonas sp.]PPD41963.1 MAG: Crp/Fnr family transcriptional regulator [Methylomonas sp.]